MPKFNGRRDKHDEHDNTHGQPAFLKKAEAQRIATERAENKVETLKSSKHSTDDGTGRRTLDPVPSANEGPRRSRGPSSLGGIV